MARAYDEEDHPLSERGIEQQNEGLLRRYRDFRRGADAVTTVWRAHPEVIAVSLIGSVARAPWKEVPPLRTVPARADRAVARVQGRRSRLVARPPGLARHASPGQGPGATHTEGRGGHRHRITPGRRVHSRARHRPLPRTAVRFQRLSQGESGMPDPGLRGCGAAASARGVQVASGEPGRESCGPAIRAVDRSAAPCERSAAS